MIDADACYRAVQSRDARFDGQFFTGVRSTGIYCRPSCPALTPRRSNVSFLPSAAAAQRAGFRACKRCRPDATPGSPEWNGRADVVGRAMRLIADGVVDRDGVSALASRLGYSERHLHRQLVTEVGAGPLALARAQRAHAARVLLEMSALPVADVAFASGFASVRQFNDTMRSVYATTPSALRHGGSQGRRRGRIGKPGAGSAPASAPGLAHAPAPGLLSVRLAFRPPCDLVSLFEFLAARAVAGTEEVVDGVYRRTLRLPRGHGIVELVPGDGSVGATFRLTDLRDIAAAVARCRRLLDLDADPVAVAGDLRSDRLLRPLVDANPGLRVPGAVCGEEVAMRAVVGQQVSVAAARTLTGQLVARLGTPLAVPDGGLTHLFPSAQAVADADPACIPLPVARRAALQQLARALADGTVELHPGVDRAGVVRQLQALPGVGPWTANYVALRALGDPDIFLGTDLGVRRALDQLGQASRPSAVAELSARWRPWRSYALHHLWSTLDPPRKRSSYVG